MSVKSAFRKLQRAFSAKDERAFDEAIEELEDNVEDRSRDGEEEPDTVEIHNHIPDSRDGIGEMPSLEREGELHARDEEPEWFKKFNKDCMDRFRKMHDDISALQKWAQEEGDEPEHQEDRRDRRDRRDGGGLANLGEHAEHDEGEESDLLDMDRHMDSRRGRDEEEEELRGEDRRDRSRDRRDRRDRRADDDEPNKAILGELEFEAPPGIGVDKARKARDSVYFEDSFQDVVSKAEILAPGIRIPTFDSKAPPLKTLRAILGLRTTALDLAYSKPETRGLIDAAMSGRTLDTKRMSPAATRVLFNSVAAAVASSNNSRTVDRTGGTVHGASRTNLSGTIQSLKEINARNRERFGRKTA